MHVIMVGSSPQNRQSRHFINQSYVIEIDSVLSICVIHINLRNPCMVVNKPPCKSYLFVDGIRGRERENRERECRDNKEVRKELCPLVGKF